MCEGELLGESGARPRAEGEEDLGAKEYVLSGLEWEEQGSYGPMWWWILRQAEAGSFCKPRHREFGLL